MKVSADTGNIALEIEGETIVPGPALTWSEFRDSPVARESKLVGETGVLPPVSPPRGRRARNDLPRDRRGTVAAGFSPGDEESSVAFIYRAEDGS